MLAVTVVRENGRVELALGHQDEPKVTEGQALVAVRAVSLNNGEVREVFAAPAGHCFGWDFAGIVLRALAGAGVAIGERVFGLASGTGRSRSQSCALSGLHSRWPLLRGGGSFASRRNDGARLPG